MLAKLLGVPLWAKIAAGVFFVGLAVAWLRADAVSDVLDGLRADENERRLEDVNESIDREARIRALAVCDVLERRLERMRDTVTDVEREAAVQRCREKAAAPQR